MSDSTGRAESSNDWSAKHTRLRWGMVSSAAVFVLVAHYAKADAIDASWLTLQLSVPKPVVLWGLAGFMVFQTVAFILRTIEETPRMPTKLAEDLQWVTHCRAVIDDLQDKVRNDISEIEGHVNRIPSDREDKEVTNLKKRLSALCAEFEKVVQRDVRDITRLAAVLKAMQSPIDIQRWAMDVVIPLLVTFALFVLALWQVWTTLCPPP